MSIQGTRETAALERDAQIYGELVDRHQLAKERFDVALAAAKRTGVDLEIILLERCRVPKRTLGDALSSFHRCPFIEPDPKTPVAPDLLAKLNPHYLLANLWAPMWREAGTIHVVIHDPRMAVRVQDIQQLFPGSTLRFYVALRRDITRFIEALPGAALKKPATIEEILSRDDPAPPETAEARSGEEPHETDSVVVKLANQLIADACQAHASDVHIEPYKEKDLIVRFRVDGECRIHQRLPARYRQALVSRLKIMAGLDIAERRRPQDGKITVRAEGARVEIRMATLPTAGGLEDVVLRLAGSSEPVPLDRSGLSSRNLVELLKMLDRPHGLILCVGPTGSGKTTTLHSCLFYLNGPDLKIWTAEDPVEITQYGLRQVQVNPRIGLTFAMALRAFLRADPDVIMVGEMRDKETAEAAVEASAEAERAIRGELGEKAPAALALHRGAGCGECGGTGYSGRIAIHELLVATPEIKRLVQRKAPAAEIAELARAQGMTTLAQDGFAKCLAGETDYAQVFAACG